MTASIYPSPPSLSSPPALGLAPASTHSSEITVQFTHTPSQDDTALGVCAAPLDGIFGSLLPGVTSQLAAKRDLGVNEKDSIDDRRGAAVNDSQRAASRCQRSKHHPNRNTPVATRVTVKLGRWNELARRPFKWKKQLINFPNIFSYDASVVPAFCWRVWSVFKELPWQKDKQMLRDVWPVSWWRAVGILKSHFLVFKRHPSRVDSDFLSCLTAAVQSVASQVLRMHSEVLQGAFGLPLWSASGQMAARCSHFWQLPPGRNTSRK